MAGVGVRLKKLYGRNTISSNLLGFIYSAMISVAPMLLIMGTLLLLQKLLHYDQQPYLDRELFSCTILYIFVFSLLTSSPFNAVLSKYLSDVIFEERYEDIMPCFYVGLFINLLFSSIIGIPFCVREYLVGGIDPLYVLTGYCGYMVLTFVFYAELYLNICKDYRRITLFFAIGMAAGILLGILLVYVFSAPVMFTMLLSMVFGLSVIGLLEFAVLRSYFRENSGNYRPVLRYMKSHSALMIANSFYTFGMYVHNMIFWTTDMKMVVADSFVCAPNYDLASCIAMFTNISSTIILTTRIETHFHARYKAFTESIIGGRGHDIENAKFRMFEQLAEELMNLVRVQFIVSVIVFLLAIVFLPRIGFGGLVIQIYPCMAAGYFIMFIMYGVMEFLYYYDDNAGAVLTACIFFGVTALVSLFARSLPANWNALGLVLGSFCGFSVAYFRLAKLEKNIDVHIFCRGNILPHKSGTKPSNLVYVNNAFFEKKADLPNEK